MLPRFYAPGLDPAATRARAGGRRIAPPDAGSCASASGDEVAIFDGRGHEFLARVERADRDAATVALVEPIASAPEPAVRVTLVQAVLKGDKMDEVVRDATMAGVVAHRAGCHRPHGDQGVGAQARPRRGALAAGRDRVRQAVPARVGAADRAGDPARRVAGGAVPRPAAAARGAVGRRRRGAVDAPAPGARAPRIRGVPGRPRRRVDARRARGGASRQAASPRRSARSRCAPMPSRSRRSPR